MKLNKKLKSLDKYPFHMPGHKRNEKFNIAGAEIDITEIDGFDNLHSADGVLLDIENRLTAHYGSEKSYLLVGGSTLGIITAIFCLCDVGDKIIVARNCHKSVYNACCLRKLEVVYIEPEFDSECGYYTNILQSTVDKATQNHPDAKAVVITSPTYEGIISDIQCDLPLIVDAAHGAHLGIAPFPKYPSGDIVISSLHKTLPALTQTAVANIYNPTLVTRYKKYLDMLETSSPSYVLMNSADICADYLDGCEEDFKVYYHTLCDLRSAVLKYLKVKHSDDIGKVIVSTKGASIDAKELAETLSDRFDIEIEAALSEHIIIMTSIADTKEALEHLKATLITIDRECDKGITKPPFEKPPCPAEVIEITDCDGGALTDISEADGRIANEFIYAYPPDIPLIVPGEIISGEICDYITDLIQSGVNVVSDTSNLPKVLTKED